MIAGAVVQPKDFFCEIVRPFFLDVSRNVPQQAFESERADPGDQASRVASLHHPDVVLFHPFDLESLRDQVCGQRFG